MYYVDTRKVFKEHGIRFSISHKYIVDAIKEIYLYKYDNPMLDTDDEDQLYVIYDENSQEIWVEPCTM